jgi:hypothetical protein
MKMMRSGTVALIILAALFLGVSYADENPVKITGIFSDMEFISESGDVLGQEVIIGFSRDGYYVVFQESEGVPSIPIVTLAKVTGSSITFKLSPTNPADEFRGIISEKELVGAFQNHGKTYRLKRKNSYWQRLPPQKPPS